MSDPKKPEFEVSASSVESPSVAAPAVQPPRSTNAPSPSAPSPTPRKSNPPLRPKVVVNRFDAQVTHPGDVLLVDVPKGSAMGHEQAYERPWVVISGNRAHRMPLNMVVAVPLTKHVEKLGQFRETRILVPAALITSTDPAFKVVDSLALTEQVRAISLERADRKIGTVTVKTVDFIRAAVRYLLEL